MIERVSMDTPPQAVVMSLAHNHLQISFSLVTEELPLSNLRSKSNFMLKDDKALLYWSELHHYL